jgi:hypothetical protein
VFTTVALLAALVFGTVLLVGADWVPGVLIVAAALAGSAVEIPAIRRGRRAPLNESLDD